jgi:hypothetical protein
MSLNIAAPFGRLQAVAETFKSTFVNQISVQSVGNIVVSILFSVVNRRSRQK